MHFDRLPRRQTGNSRRLINTCFAPVTGPRPG
jgi:hypothetical protein